MKKFLPKFIKTALKSAAAKTGRFFEYTPANIRIFNDPRHQIFFGYYDISPFSAEDRFLLACRALADNKSPHAADSQLELGFFDFHQENPTFQKFGTTETWNWQQGCRLQWLDSERVIYNKVIEGVCGSVIQNIKSGKIEKSFTQPVYSVGIDYALTLDFGKLHNHRRGYGYHKPKSRKPHDDILLLNLHSGEHKTALTMQEAHSFEPHDDMREATHYFNHLCFSPSSTHFMVTHLWVTKQGKRRSRILVRDLENGPILCPNNTGHTSHYCWHGDDQVLIFHSANGHDGDYILYDLINGTQEIVAGQYFTQDGHPSLTNQILVTDTYPNLLGLQQLFVFNRATKAVKTIAKLYSPPQFNGELRCDLHPRLNRAHTMICVDAIRDGRRAMLLLQLGQ